MNYADYLKIINQNEKSMTGTLIEWAGINTGSANLEGLEKQLTALKAHFSKLSDDTTILETVPKEIINSKGEVAQLKVGRVLRVVKRPNAKFRILFVGHYDTVFPKDHVFQKVTWLDDNTLQGPGVSDLKGGLVILWQALNALEQSPYAENIGWEILLNGDEEIGSYGSTKILEEAAKRHHLGLIFEPSLPNGSLVGKRKGSGCFHAVFHGIPAHVGREHEKGRSAILAMAGFITKVEALNKEFSRTIFNVGRVEGGGPINVVPDLAICEFNIRIDEEADAFPILERLKTFMQEANQKKGITAKLHGSFYRPPKPVTSQIRKIFEALSQCAHDENVTLEGLKETGGCCDGNNLAAVGLPNLDTLGARGANIHSDQEYVLLDSLVERARLVALFLMKIGSGEINGPELVS